ncbi:DUF2071 domain-containing protein [Streptomyces sp. NPDC052079]|uniref:DUF2071 domain-containing protein n=1 Tax=Streptomyces sp. NPDC052079 TaxID=3155526 RepID=UPI0034349C67
MTAPPGDSLPRDLPETTVHLCCVDSHGRRGVASLSLNAPRLIPGGGRAPGVRDAVRLVPDERRPSRRRHRRIHRLPTVARAGRRGRPAHRAPRGPIGEPTELEHFLTARWGMHGVFFGRPAYLPNPHPRWPLHRGSRWSARGTWSPRSPGSR